MKVKEIVYTGITATGDAVADSDPINKPTGVVGVLGAVLVDFGSGTFSFTLVDGAGVDLLGGTGVGLTADTVLTASDHGSPTVRGDLVLNVSAEGGTNDVHVRIEH